MSARGATALFGALRSTLRVTSSSGAGAAALAAAAASTGPAAALHTTSSAVPSLASAASLRRGLSLGLGLASAAAVASLGLAAPTSSCAPGAPSETTTTALPIDLSRAGVGNTTPGGARTVVFVLGGPGSGKGTQCARLVSEFGVVHLSAGDLLRAHCASGTPDGQLVAGMIKDGAIVPSRVTISLLEAAMEAALLARKHAPTTFLVDGFPRNAENRAAYEAQTGADPAFVLFFDCPEDVMSTRLAGRGQGRTDDNAATIAKRFAVFRADSMPVVDHYEALGKVRRFNADRSPDDIYGEVRKYFL